MKSPEQKVRPKPTIVHVINSLMRGGAETLLVSLLPELQEHYNIILVTLTPDNDFGEQNIACQQLYCLHYSGFASIPLCVFRLRAIIRRHKPQLVRSQLYISSVIARLATPQKVPFVFSIHNPMSLDSYEKNTLALPMEKLTYRKKHHLISVSRDALLDFDKHVGIKGGAYVLYNFVNQKYVDHANVKSAPAGRSLKLVAVGNLKEQKNYGYLIEAFRKLKTEAVSLDIYGEGNLRQSLQEKIDRHQLNITLKGKSKEVYKILPAYDLYVMCSHYEGFGVAPLEAMAMGLPLLLSDLPVLREVTFGNALFFDQKNSDDFVRLLMEVKRGAYDLEALSRQGIAIAKEHYQQKDYFTKLASIYSSIMTG